MSWIDRMRRGPVETVVLAAGALFFRALDWLGRPIDEVIWPDVGDDDYEGPTGAGK